MNSYGTGYDNQFCFLVMPIASKGSLRSQIDAAIIAQVEATGVVPRFGQVDRSVSAIIDAKTSYVSQSPERLLSPIELVQCLSDALNGIRFLNSKGIAHSDIKLENILVSGVRSAAVTDFGLARPYGVPLNGTFGTPGYYPAELEKMLPDFCIVDPLLDSYAFGMCLQNVIKQGRPYSQPNTARFVGASFNRAELSVLMRKEPNVPLDDILAPYFLYRPEDDITPVAQRPLSIEMANLFVSTLSMCADILTKQKFVDDAKTTFRTRTSLRDHKVMESNIINRLLGVQIMLDWLLEMLFKSAKNQ
jgi:serine/threonine protein kinase